jgi:CheY-like chemotaxis protein
MGGNLDSSRLAIWGDCDLGGLRVLVVEDDAENRRVLATLLEAYGADVLGVGSCADALDAYEAYRPSVLVTDVWLGGPSGFSLVGELRARGERTPAVAISAVGSRAEARANGCQAYLAKPVRARALAETVRALADAASAPDDPAR